MYVAIWASIWLTWCVVDMVVHFQQSAALATDWANHDAVKSLAVNHALCRVENKKKISRSSLLACLLFFADLACCQPCLI